MSKLVKMNLESSKVTNEEKVELCKKYFYLGWLVLPFVWGINAVWFYKEAFIKPEFPGQVRLRKPLFQNPYHNFSKTLLYNFRRQSRSW